jgi:hypothetical protein
VDLSVSVDVLRFQVGLDSSIQSKLLVAAFGARFSGVSNSVYDIVGGAGLRYVGVIRYQHTALAFVEVGSFIGF